MITNRISWTSTEIKREMSSTDVAIYLPALLMRTSKRLSLFTILSQNFLTDDKDAKSTTCTKTFSFLVAFRMASAALSAFVKSRQANITLAPVISTASDQYFHDVEHEKIMIYIYIYIYHVRYVFCIITSIL